MMSCPISKVRRLSRRSKEYVTCVSVGRRGIVCWPASICALHGCSCGHRRECSSGMTKDFTDSCDLGVSEIELAIVILAYGASDQASGLLASLRAKRIPIHHRTIVVHNPRGRGADLQLPEQGDIRIIQLGSNRGYVGGMNAGIRSALASKPRFVLLLTHDVRIDADAVQRLCALMHDHRRVAVMGPILSGSDGPYSAGFIRDRGVRMRHRVPFDGMPGPVWPCVAIDGSAMFWRASALAEMGGFDERFFMYFEDVDICMRARRSGWAVAVASAAFATSAPGGGHRRSAHAYLRARNGLAYARTFGTSGLVAGLIECFAGLWFVTPKPGGRHFHDQKARKLAAAYWHSTLLGLLDYYRGRWGPPPPAMLRDSDIAAVP
jgi:N-acetylglucosaminyl-diphospho-decaprenol L-rhamnosyltransferase